MAGIVLNRSRQAPAEDTPAFGGIAERFRRAGDLDRAIALCRDGLKKFPDQLSARVTLGWALLDKGQYDEARAELERVLRKAPDNLAAIRGLAELHDRSEGSMPAEESWQQEEAPPEIPAAAPATAVQTPAAQHAASPAAPGPAAAVGSGRTAVKPKAQTHEDPFAPIAVSLPASSVAEAPELLQTAEQAGLAAEEAAAESSLLGESVDQIKVEIENPAAASMAAAGAVAESASGSSVELADPMSLALEAAGVKVDAALVPSNESEPVSFDAGDTSQFDSLVTEPEPAPSIELGEEHGGVATTEAADTDELDNAIRALELAGAASGPAIDLGSSTDPVVAVEPDPEIIEASRALAALSLNEPIAGSAETEAAPVAEETVIDFGVAEAVALAEAAVAAEQPALANPEPQAIAVSELEPEPEQIGPVFELVPPEPVDLADGFDVSEAAEYELDAGTDEATADLFAMMAAEPEPEPETEVVLASVPEPVLLAEQPEAPARPNVAESSDEAIAAELKALEAVPAAPDPVAEVLLDEEDEAEHFVDVADTGPAWVPDPADVRPAVQAAATEVVFSALAEIGLTSPSKGVVNITSMSRGSSRAQASVVALERLLKKVEARRVQLQSESVA